VRANTFPGTKKIHIGRTHVALPRLDDTVLLRDPSESLDNSPVGFGRLSIPTDVDEIEAHDDV
jgi:hypothetical protein